jgi:hypothetical protein
VLTRELDAAGQARVDLTLAGKPGKNVLRWKFARRGDWFDVIGAWRPSGRSIWDINTMAREFRNKPARLREFGVRRSKPTVLGTVPD